MVEEAARNSGFSTGERSGLTSYMRKVVLGHNPPSVFDKRVEQRLCQIHADLGRIGGILKLGITNGADIPELRETARQMLETRVELKELIRGIRDGEYCSSKGK